MRYVHHCALRWSDMDAYGHVNNTRFLTLYEEARVAFIYDLAKERGTGSLLDEGVVIARHEIDYLRPVVYNTDPDTAAPPPPSVRIELWIENMRGAQFTVVYELFDGDRLASRARTVCVPFDLRKQHPRRIAPVEREFLSRYLRDPAGSPQQAPAAKPDPPQRRTAADNPAADASPTGPAQPAGAAGVARPVGVADAVAVAEPVGVADVAGVARPVGVADAAGLAEPVGLAGSADSAGAASPAASAVAGVPAESKNGTRP